ncbi:MAG: hypothetical protein KY455_05770 [Euryarchaeota archaeon]|nr:hypothetical protein [Euryarchaeota archaeon]
MTDTRQTEATAGLIAHVLFGATVAILFLVGALALDLIPFFDGKPLQSAIHDGQALPVYFFGFLVLLAVFSLITTWEMGRSSARTGNPIRSQAALTVLFGAFVAWVNIVVSMLFVSTLVSTGRFDATVDLALESFVFLVIGAIPVTGLGIFTASFSRDHYLRLDGAVPDPVVARFAPATPYAAAAPSDDAPIAHPSGGNGGGLVRTPDTPPLYGGGGQATVMANRIEQFPIDCPGCSEQFLAEGERPLRIECPSCGKSGTIR